ncbi:hypothetical protein CAEBREN_12620 [Caenorhabditis brenneri]|uniref:Uncharacterized protein n=1 Tax=Caenorhabditis brenneri TaxID=135651 RepID=G0NKI9_CAEBE|nr:hypothetical protein CAEBREN_12620 [Caenorhabditis brenneri]
MVNESLVALFQKHSRYAHLLKLCSSILSLQYLEKAHRELQRMFELLDQTFFEVYVTGHSDRGFQHAPDSSDGLHPHTFQPTRS